MNYKKLIESDKSPTEIVTSISEGASEVRELVLYAETNDGRAWNELGRHLSKFHRQGRWDRNLAMRSVSRFVDDQAKAYASEYGQPGDWNQIFSVRDRQMAAEEILDGFESEFEIGNYWS